VTIAVPPSTAGVGALLRQRKPRLECTSAPPRREGRVALGPRAISAGP
jgi:hypothetical protein